ncbi:rhodanese-like domain-containing protein [Halorubellus sp. JP-L1]|uniref:rhodanese-like domain-containing protein n=1 Tax=Halorubellus sp. JP-L1 TaxID=2715753 RepID=UPI00140B60A2|nr:rhodanese-like domain-containing protein [Halorubellus sp. JP-L1]NHN41963.1 rhodanese-like domain-containing protein [Halorubellus sp. JP-L1]
MDGEVDPDRVETLRDDDDVDVCIVDIRNPSSYARGHVPDSLNVPLPELTGEVDALPDADRYVTVCPHGKSSVQAARLIASYAGVDAPVESMAGGLTAYDGDLVTSGGSTDGPDGSTDGPAAPF